MNEPADPFTAHTCDAQCSGPARDVYLAMLMAASEGVACAVTMLGHADDGGRLRVTKDAISIATAAASVLSAAAAVANTIEYKMGEKMVYVIDT
jgi:hypothetical protein